MTRTIGFSTAAIILFALGIIAANTRIAQGVIPVTPYEADVNKDRHVNVADLGHVASRYGQVVPTATAVLAAAANTTYVVESRSRSTATAYCDDGDAVTGGGFTALPFITEPADNRPYSDGALNGWRVTWNANLDITAYVVCLDNAPTHTP